MEKQNRNLPLIITDHLISDHKPTTGGFSFYLAGLVQGCGIIENSGLTLKIPGIERSLAYYLKKKLGYGEIEEIDEIESNRRSHFILKAPILSNHLSNHLALDTSSVKNLLMCYRFFTGVIILTSEPNPQIYTTPLKYSGRGLLFLYELIKNKLINTKPNIFANVAEGGPRTEPLDFAKIQPTKIDPIIVAPLALVKSGGNVAQYGFQNFYISTYGPILYQVNWICGNVNIPSPCIARGFVDACRGGVSNLNKTSGPYCGWICYKKIGTLTTPCYARGHMAHRGDHFGILTKRGPVNKNGFRWIFVIKPTKYRNPHTPRVKHGVPGTFGRTVPICNSTILGKVCLDINTWQISQIQIPIGTPCFTRAPLTKTNASTFSTEPRNYWFTGFLDGILKGEDFHLFFKKSILNSTHQSLLTNYHNDRRVARGVPTGVGGLLFEINIKYKERETEAVLLICKYLAKNPMLFDMGRSTIVDPLNKKLKIKIPFPNKIIRELIWHFDHHPFISSKYVKYFKYRKIYRICQRKEHLNKKGALKVLSIWRANGP